MRSPGRLFAVAALAVALALPARSDGPPGWRATLAGERVPDTPVVGLVRGQPFRLDRAVHDQNLHLIQLDSAGRVERELIVWFTRNWPGRLLPTPRRLALEPTAELTEVLSVPSVYVHSRTDPDQADDQLEGVRYDVGFALRLEIDPPKDGASACRIWLCLPDAERSWVAGGFRLAFDRSLQSHEVLSWLAERALRERYGARVNRFEFSSLRQCPEELAGTPDGRATVQAWLGLEGAPLSLVTLGFARGDAGWEVVDLGAAAAEPSPPPRLPPPASREDRHGDPLPPGALARLGTTRGRPCFKGIVGLFAIDEDHAVSVGTSGELRVWDAGGRLVRELSCGEGSWGPHGFAISPDRNRLACVSSETVTVLELGRGLIVAQLDFSRPISATGWSPDGTRLACAEEGGTIRVVDPAVGRLVGALTGAGRTTALAFSPSGARLASVAEDGQLRLWDIARAEAIGAWVAHDGGGSAVVFLGEDRVATAGPDRGVHTWSVPSGERIATLRGERDGYYALALSRDGRRLAGGADGGVDVWDVATGKRTDSLPGHRTHVLALDWTPAGSLVASMQLRPRRWDPTLRQATPEDPLDPVTDVAFLADGRRVLTGSWDGARVWDAATGAPLARLHVALPPRDPLIAFEPIAVAASPVGPLVAVGWYRGAELWSLDGSPRRVHSLPSGAGALAFTRDGSSVAASGRPLTLWGTAEADIQGRIGKPDGWSGWSGSLAVSPSGSRIACIDPTGAVRIYEMKTGRLVHQLFALNLTRLKSTAWSPDGSCVAGAGWDGTIRMWDSSTGALLGQMPGCTEVNALAYSPDGRYFAAGLEDGSVSIWPVAAPDRALRFTGHADAVNALAWSPDGTRVVSASDDGTALVWEVTGE